MERSRIPFRGALVGCLLLLSVAASAARVGDVAPAFELPNTMGDPVALADYSGMPTVIVFYRGLF
ncbi:MAG: redoxin domain-containing protein [Myxococcota bacterium]